MTADHIVRAADEISGIQVGTGYESVTIDITAALEAARALGAAGLLVTPERDAAVAAEALREAAPRFRHDRPSASVWAEMLDLADQIEAGESDAER